LGIIILKIFFTFESKVSDNSKRSASQSFLIHAFLIQEMTEHHRESRILRMHVLERTARVFTIF
jgi:hypothetical protein